MAPEIQVGAILISDRPKLFGVETERYSGRWSVVRALDGFAFDRKIRDAGWNFFFIASEVRVSFFGAPGAKKVQHALDRILAKVHEQHFNSLQLTGIVAKRFLGLPYTVVAAHSRHFQRSCYLDGVDARRLSERDTTHAETDLRASAGRLEPLGQI
jgi:hypothetical protein